MLTVKDIMSVKPLTVEPGDTLQTVVALINNYSYRHFPVMEDDRLVGIITDRDVRLAVEVSTLGRDIEARIERLNLYKVADYMTENPVTITMNATVQEAAELLCTHHFDALPVVENGTLIGILTVTDYVQHIASGGRF